MLPASRVVARRASSVDVERDPKRVAQPIERLRIELAAPPAERALRDREEVVAVDDALPRKSMLASERNFRRKPADGAGDGGDGDVREQGNRNIARDDHCRPDRACEPDVANLAAIQSGSPPSARSKAISPASPTSPTHSSCGWAP